MTPSARKLPEYRKTKRLKGAERRRMILVAAQSLLLEGGFSALTLRSAAEAAGVRLATLQYYFPNWESLFNATFENVTEAAWDELLLQSKVSLTQDPVARLREFLSGLVAIAKDPVLAGMFVELWAAARTRDFAASLMRQYYDQATTLVGDLIKEAYPDLTPRVRKQRAALVVAAVEGLTLFHQMDHREGLRQSISDRQSLASLMAIVQPGAKI